MNTPEVDIFLSLTPGRKTDLRLAGGYVARDASGKRKAKNKNGDKRLRLSLGMGYSECLILAGDFDEALHPRDAAGKFAEANVRDFLNKDVRPGNNIISVAHRKVFSVANKELLKKHRETGQKTEELYPQGVTRETVGRFHLGFNYENNVRAQQAREGLDADFEKQPMWVSKAHPEGAGQHDKDNPQIITHVDTGRKYLQLRPHTDPDGNVRREHERWKDNATRRVLQPEEVKDIKKNLLPGVGKPADQGDSANKIPVRAIPLSDIYALRASKDKGWKKINQAAHDESDNSGTRILSLAQGDDSQCGSICKLMAKHDAACDKWDAKDKAVSA